MKGFVAVPISISSIIVLLGSMLLIAFLLLSFSHSSLYSNFGRHLNGNQSKMLNKDYDYSVGEVPKNISLAFPPQSSQKSDLSAEVEKSSNDSSYVEGIDSKEPDALFSSEFADDLMKNDSEIGNYTTFYRNQSVKIESLPSPPVQNIIPRENFAKDYGKSDTRNCDLYHGKWIYDALGPVYANNTCPILAQGQNCQGNGRPDKSYENWRWKPNQCELPRFNGRTFLELLKGKTLAFVGDSLARNQMESLLCMLWQTEVPVSRSYSRMHRWHFKSTSTTIIRIWSAWLVKKTDLPSKTSSSPRAVNVHLDIPDTSFTDFLPNFDILILSTGHWFTSESTYLINNKTVVPRRHLRRRKRKRTAKKKLNKNIYFYSMAFETALKAINSARDYKGLTILRSYSPEHYVGGAWNDGGSCLGVDRVSSKSEVSLHSGMMKEKQMEVFESVGKSVRNGKFLYMDITEMSGYRHDGHPSLYSGRVQTRNGKVEDCTHWCMPGPVDTWNEILFEVLKREL